ncbi:hypothetical protein TcWFU_003251 [Taenia crassiceps]|uniref:Uncharacterized protein n=1 Tax=Taenia crassiceps TaxID=6207 RepID=A0ABR4Q946_9CEST
MPIFNQNLLRLGIFISHCVDQWEEMLIISAGYASRKGVDDAGFTGWQSTSFRQQVDWLICSFRINSGCSTPLPPEMRQIVQLFCDCRLHSVQAERGQHR